jgi:hypothetical protein
MRVPDDHEGRGDEGLEAPPELVSALKRLRQRRPVIPPTVDEAMFRAARRHLGEHGDKGAVATGFGLLSKLLREFRALSPWVAATAVVVAGFLAIHFLLGRPRALVEQKPTKPVESAGVEQGSSGERAARQNPESRPLDIVDALRLAKRLESGPVRESRWDVNRDGVVDGRDVQTIVVRAVRLEKGGRS